MNEELTDSLWERALHTLFAAKKTLSFSPDTAANRAYYVAFYAVSALFSAEDSFFRKHTGLRSAVHRELVHTGRWPVGLGDDYDKLHKLRDVADYGMVQRASEEDAGEAICRAERILKAVSETRPDLFSMK